jgi:Tfp pilus assembly protein PilV
MIGRLLALRASLLRGALRRVGEERGLSLVEVVLAMVLFMVVAAALAGALTSAIAANDVARERTIAQQASQGWIEQQVRRRPYNEVGTPAGNPSGLVPATSSIDPSVYRGLDATLTTQIQWVNDPTPTSYATSANYKKVTVTVTRDNDGRVLSRSVTYVAPPGRAPFGGINNAIVNVNVQDMGLNQPSSGATVNLTGGPSAPLSDVTGTTGLVTFPALTPSPPTYSIAVTKSGGYVTLADDQPGTAPATADLAPTQTFDTTIRIFKPASIHVVLRSGGSPYTGAATVKILSSFRSTTTTVPFVPADGGQKTVSTLTGPFGSEPVVPGQQYTLRAYTSTGNLCTTAASETPQYVPSPGDYPGITQRTFTLDLVTCPSGALNVDVTQLGGPAAGAVVTVSGGPNDLTPTSQTTNASGRATFASLPAGTQSYTISVSRCGQNASDTAVITVGGTTTRAVTLPSPPTGSVRATVLWGGSNVSNATVRLTNTGSCPIDITGGPTGGTGQVLFTNIPSGSGYSVQATHTPTGQTASQSGITVTTGGTATPTLNLPTATLTVNVKRGAVNQNNARVTLQGGPMSVNLTANTNSSGNATFSNVPVGAGYNVYARANPCSSVSNPKSGQQLSVTISAPTTNVNIVYSLSTCPLP